MDGTHLEFNMNRFLSQTGCTVYQRNGQRFCQTPRALKEVKHLKMGHEVFVGKLPRDCYENEIYPLFSKVGDIYEMRLMMDFSGFNRGFCYVKYFKRRAAELAVKLLDKEEIRPGCHIVVRKSLERNDLTVYNVDKYIFETMAAQELRAIVENVTEVSVFRDGMSKQAKIVFDCHISATTAMKNSAVRMQTIFGPNARITWSHPVTKKERNTHRTLQKNLYTRQQKENKCPNNVSRDLFAKCRRHKQQNNPLCSSSNSGCSELASSLLVEDGNQIRAQEQFDNIQNGKKYLFEKMFSMPADYLKKQNVTTNSHNNHINPVDSVAAASLPVEDYNQMRAHEQFGIVQNRKKNLFEKIFSIPASYLKKQNVTTNSHNSHINPVDSAAVVTNNNLEDTYTDVNDYFQSLWNLPSGKENSSNMGACALPPVWNENSDLKRIYTLPQNYFRQETNTVCPGYSYLDKPNIQDGSMFGSNFMMGNQHTGGQQDRKYLPYTASATSGMI